MLFVRENTEGEYAGVGGRAHRGLPLEVGIETSVFTRAGVERVVRLRLRARREPSRRRSRARRSRTPPVRLRALGRGGRGGRTPSSRTSSYERVLVDALAARMVRDPGSLDVVVASNLFADILTDLAAAIQGGMGMAPRARTLLPGRTCPASSSPCTALRRTSPGRGGESGRRDLERVADARAPRRATPRRHGVLEALEAVCRDGPRTRDVGGEASTREVGEAVAARVAD